MTILYLKAFHIIFIVSLFAGLFFLGRMLIYLKEANETGPQPIIDLSISAAKRVWYIITLPSLIITLGIGLTIAYHIGAFREGWMHLKLLLVILLVCYTFYINKLRLRLSKNEPSPKSWQLRLINEVPFFFLVAIVFTVYMKNLFSGIWAILVMAMLAVIIILLMMLRKKPKTPTQN